MLTSDRTLVPGAELRHGTKGAYRAVVAGPGEPHLRRTELAPAAGDGSRVAPIAVIAHVTDLHVVDVSSPARLDSLAPRASDPRWAYLVSGGFRPQEALAVHAAAAAASTLDRVTGPATGRPVELAVVTGDNVDNAQANEVVNYLAALDGGRVQPASGDGSYRGLQRIDHGGTWFWLPDEDHDRLQTAWGFPSVPGLLDRASAAFDARGTTVPWLACYGNHDALVAGTSRPTPAIAELAVGSRRPVAPDYAFDPDVPIDDFLECPERAYTGASVPTIADHGRRFVSAGEFVAAHFGPRSQPHGHGFDLASGVAHYAYDHGPVRLVVLDTTHPAGYWDGSIDRPQLEWLERQLADAARDERLVIVASHHATPSLVNDYTPTGAGTDRSEPAVPRHLAADLVTVLHRHPCVIAWLNGHHHANRVVAHPRDGGGFWEITTSAVIDHPCQTRLVEVVDELDGHVALVSTMIDLPGPLDPAAAPDDPLCLVAWHRELAANLAWQHASHRAGEASDRNVALVLPHPFAR